MEFTKKNVLEMLIKTKSWDVFKSDFPMDFCTNYSVNPNEKYNFKSI